jgi:hypothetical protein
LLAGTCCALSLWAPALLATQEVSIEPAQEPAQDRTAPANAQANPLVTVHGEVRNAETGQPIPRALVRIEGDADTGTLTNGEGRFEIPGVLPGPQLFEVRKPGFRDRPYGAGALFMDEKITPPHNVLVAAEMPDLVFTLAPTCSIHGQIDLSTGDPAQGIGVELVVRTVEGGQVQWQAAHSTKTNSEGMFRFAGLAEGTYAIYTEPAMESEPATTLVEADSAGTVEHAGYATVFYPDARDQAGAASIRLSSGEQAQANLTLALEPFHTVSASVAPPHDRATGAASDRAGMAYSALIMDSAGHQLPYRANYDQETHTIQALLPDGTYSLLVSSVPRQTAPASQSNAAGADPDAEQLVGSVDFSVAGHAVPNLRVPLSVSHPSPVQVTLARTATQAAARQNVPVVVVAIRAGGWIDDSMVSVYANGSGPGPIEAKFTLPGAYWVRTYNAHTGLCEASFTAGGSNLAREPAMIGLSGSAAPMELSLRDDCARLTLSLPLALMALSPGEEPSYTVYVVPDFDSTVDVTPLTLRPSTGGTFTLDNLTPGDYHVYIFDSPARLEYRNPAVLAALPNPGQAVTLSPGGTSSLVLEAPEH